ncbi:MAG: helix-turn-helix domain-containing protein [Gammaproteobacteria bacterium]|nr:helix-turn-helix domain-containing protein [Gammaproteobacteria bacterium]
MPTPIISQLTVLVVGFSVFSAAILLIAYLFFIKDMRKSAFGMLACAVLLAALSGLQYSHLQFLQHATELFESRFYVAMLLLTPPAFYFFSREILLPESRPTALDIVHLLPLMLSFVMPSKLVIPLALSVGAGYAIWLARIVLGIRRQVRRFKFEVFFFGFFALLATTVLVLAIATPYVSTSLFYLTYANMTGLALILVVAALISFPDLLSDISAAAEMTYAASTLKNIDTAAKLNELERLMGEDKLFQNETLNLGSLADAIDLSPHQLSELINTHFGFGFSRYVRERRVAEARELLLSDKTSSVLSIGLMTGFKSQSNFYTAFREVTGQSPGEYRKNS